MRNLLIFVVLAALPQVSYAQQTAISPDSLTILVNGVMQSVEKTGQPVSVFDRSAIEQVQGADLTRLIERAPGLTVSRNGGPGGFTSVSVRGAEGEQLLVLIDGVRVADPASPGGGFDFGNLLMGNLAKVELQRGSNSTIWGSQAIGGVLAATTGSQPGASASAEYGAHDTLYATAAGSFAAGPVELGAQAARYRSAGYSAAAAGSEPDGFRQTELGGQTEIALGHGVNAFARGRYSKGRVDLDGFPAPTFALADTDEYQTTRQLSAVAGVRYSADALEVTGDWSTARTQRWNYAPSTGSAPTFTADGRSERVELRGQWRFASGVALDFGAEREWTRFSTLFDARKDTAISGAYGQLVYDRSALHAAVGVRRDEHRDFGGATSVGADASYAFGGGWRVVASYGEGFKAPTLFQLHSDFGNAALRPERSRSFDAGIAYRGPAWSTRVTAFRRDTRDLIGFVSCFGVSGGICTGRPFGTYDNAVQARAQGLEIEARVQPARVLQLGAAYSYLESEDRTPGSPAEGRELARRPRHALTLTGDWSRGKARIGADLRAVSRSFDDAANTVPLAAYAVATVRGELDVGTSITLFGRVENVFDEVYQTAAGYGTPRRGAYLGARARL